MAFPSHPTYTPLPPCLLHSQHLKSCFCGTEKLASPRESCWLPLGNAMACEKRRKETLFCWISGHEHTLPSVWRSAGTARYNLVSVSRWMSSRDSKREFLCQVFLCQHDQAQVCLWGPVTDTGKLRAGRIPLFLSPQLKSLGATISEPQYRCFLLIFVIILT